MRRLAAFTLFVIACGFFAARAAAGRAATAGRQSDLEELRQAAATLAAELSAAKREGLPLTPADLHPGGPVPASENAAPLYHRMDRWRVARDRLARKSSASEAAARQRREDAPRQVLSGRATDEHRQLAREALKEWAPFLHLAEQAAARTHCRYNLEWEKGAAMSFPPYYTPHRAVRLLAARAVLTAGEGRWEAAFADLERCAVIVRHLGEDPSLVGFMVQGATAAVPHNAFCLILRRSDNDPQVLARARQAHDALSVRFDLLRAFHGEMIFVRMAHRRARKLLADQASDEEDPGRRDELRTLVQFPEALLRDAFDARLISFYRRLTAALAKAGPDVQAMTREVNTVGTEEDGRKGLSYWATRDDGCLFDGATARYGETVARQRLREALLALLEMRRQTGAFPESPPNLPIDPFDGKPLRYRKQGEGFVLSSIGPNLKDDDGNVVLGQPDLVVAYP